MEQLQLNDEERMAAAAMHCGVLLGFAGFAPLVVWLMYKDKNPELSERAKKATLVQFITMIVVIGVAMFTCGFGSVLLLPWFGYEVYLAVNAWQGKSVGYPL